MKNTYKRLAALLLTLWLMAGTAWASEKASMPVSFRQEDQFYGFAALDQWPAELTAELRSAGLSLPLRLGPVRAAESGLPVTYLLLVDCSGSMKYTGGQVNRFISAVEAAGRDNARFLLATFGEEFILEWDGRTQEGSAAGAAKKIAYTAQKTDLSQGVLDAVDYLNSCRREPGELLNLVVITDGIPDKSEGSPELSEVARQLEEESSILVHTFGLQTDEPGSQEALETLGTLGRGAHLVSSDASRAKAAGEEMAAFINDLCVVSFTWSAQNTGGTELLLSWEDGGEQVLPVDMTNVPLLLTVPGEDAQEETDPAEPESPEVPDGPAASDEPDGSGETGNPKNPDDPGGSGETDDPKDPNGTDGSGEAGNSKDSDGTDGSGNPENPDNPHGKKFGWVIWAAAGAAGLALLVLILVLVLRKRKKPAPEPPKGSIFMRVEVISGDYAGSNELYLVNELIVGRGGRCDIPWKDKAVDPRNSRIFLRDNMVCIEDLGSRQGTALGGMRLHSPNRLRSGDEISIGPVRFRLKF